MQLICVQFSPILLLLKLMDTIAYLAVFICSFNYTENKTASLVTLCVSQKISHGIWLECAVDCENLLFKVLYPILPKKATSQTGHTSRKSPLQYHTERSPHSSKALQHTTPPPVMTAIAQFNSH